MAQQFEHSSDMGSPLRAQRMTADESRAVIALWQSERVEQTGLTDKPAVPDVAEGLDIMVEDVQRLLSEVRARREDEARLMAQEQTLSEIRLAEEERKVAEIQRQRAERRREQAEAGRYVRQVEAARRQQEIAPPEWHLHNIKKELLKFRYFYAVLFLGFLLLLSLHDSTVPQPPQATNAITISHASAAYNASGQIKSFNIACADSKGLAVTCGDDIIATEKQLLQDKHDKEVAAVQQTAEKKNHDQ